MGIINCIIGQHEGELLLSFDYIDAYGVCGAASVCQACADRHQLTCTVHQGTRHTIFIDLSHACAACIEAESRARFADAGDPVLKAHRRLVRLTPPADRRHFYHLIRQATQDPRLPAALCWICAVVSTAHRLGQDVNGVIASASQARTMMAALPSAKQQEHQP